MVLIRYYAYRVGSFFLIRIPHVHQLSLFMVQKRRRNPPRPGSLTRLFYAPTTPQPLKGSKYKYSCKPQAVAATPIQPKPKGEGRKPNTTAGWTLQAAQLAPMKSGPSRQLGTKNWERWPKSPTSTKNFHQISIINPINLSTPSTPPFP